MTHDDFLCARQREPVAYGKKTTRALKHDAVCARGRRRRINRLSAVTLRAVLPRFFTGGVVRGGGGGGSCLHHSAAGAYRWWKQRQRRAGQSARVLFLADANHIGRRAQYYRFISRQTFVNCFK